MNKHIIPILVILLLLSSGYVGISYSIDYMEQSSILTKNGDILYVGGNGTGNYTSIQGAIDDASNGDTVFVYEGEYHENVHINKSIYLVGENKLTTIINASDYRDVINISADEVTVTGFTLEESEIIWYLGAGIRVRSSNNNAFYNNRIINNDYGIRLINSSNNQIYDNIMYNNLGVAIAMQSSNNNEIYNNQAVYDGGIHLDYCSNNSIMNNEIKYSFVGISLEGSLDNIVHSNYITESIWEAISLWKGSYRNDIIGNTVVNNYDYGIHLQSSYNNISLNNVTNNDRTGIAVLAQHNIVSNNIVMKNHEGGICIHGTNNSVYCNYVSKNGPHGIEIEGDESWLNKIYKNVIIDNKIGLQPSLVNNNTVILNNFINNEINAEGLWSNTTWDDGNHGNYWSDYKGYDCDGDGIGDKPKNIENDAKMDNCPLMVPYGSNTSVRITTPLNNYLYFRNIRVLSFPWTFIFGNIKITASVANYQKGEVEVEKVEFYVDDLHRWTDNNAPYDWRWRLSSHIKHKHTIKVIAYDNTGNIASEEIKVWRFF